MKGIIKLSYYKIIDFESVQTWDKNVFESTYLEFFMQAQQFDLSGKHLTFQEILNNNPRAEQMHYLVSTAAMGFLKELKYIPDVVNAVGKLCLPFQNFKFEIVQSHIQQKAAHQVAITFYSDPLTWIDTIGNQILIAYGDQSATIKTGKDIETDLIPMQNRLSIASFQHI